MIHTPAFSADTSSSGVHLTSSVALDEILSDYAATQAQESVTMLLDSVIFEDVTIIGPDSKGRQQELNDRIRADCDLVGELALLSGDDLKQRLIYHAGSQRKGRYHERMTEASAILLDVLNNTDESRFRAELDAVRLEQWFGGSNQVRRRR